MRLARGCLLGSALLAIACGAGVQGATPAAGPCERERAQCESACESRILPGSSEKAPELRGEMKANRCRNSCRTSYDACRRSASGVVPAWHGVHDDHIHVRTACSPDEMVAGCEARGPRRPWLAYDLPPLADRDEDLALALMEPTDMTPTAVSSSPRSLGAMDAKSTP